jgi:choline transport protein
MYLSLGGFVAWFIVLLATKSRTNDASFVLASGQGISGWNQGTAWILGISNAMYNFGGSDSPIHVAEEMHSPGRKLPIVMWVPKIDIVEHQLMCDIGILLC